MNTRIRRWGNSLALRIPKEFARQIGLSSESLVSISVEGDRLIIEPVHRPTLDELLAEITPNNVHDETDWGGPMGKEVW